MCNFIKEIKIMEFKILLKTIENVKNFVRIASLYKCDITVHSIDRRYILDATSLLGIFSLDLTKPLIVNIEDIEYAESFKKDIEKFIIL